MKKLLTAIALMACLVLPLSVMAMTSISDNDLSAVTGQAGVSIGADITMNLNADIIAWGDDDGLGAGSGTTAGWVGLSGLAIDNLRIHMRTDAGMADPVVAFGLASKFFPGEWATLGAFEASLVGVPPLDAQKAMLASILATEELLTIDVYTLGTKTAVRIGLPTFEIDMASLSASVGLWTNNDSLGGSTNIDHNNDIPGTYQEMGTINMTKMVALMGKGNYVDISQNDTKSGVLINVANLGSGNLLDQLNIASMSWGDSDGLGNTTGYGELAGAHAGYIGLANFEMDALKVAATLNINVATSTGYQVPTFLGLTQAGLWAYETALPALLAANDAGTKDTVAYILHSVGAIGTTSVDIQLLANITVGELIATAVLSPVANLNNASLAAGSVLGEMYLSNFHVVIPPYAAGVTAASWVSISAH